MTFQKLFLPCLRLILETFLNVTELNVHCRFRKIIVFLSIYLYWMTAESMAKGWYQYTNNLKKHSWNGVWMCIRSCSVLKASLIRRSWAGPHIGFLFTDTVKEKTTAERQREYRARRDADPVRREKYLRSERERWRRNIEAGKKKRIIDLCEKAQRWRRKKWREAKERQRTKNHFGPPWIRRFCSPEGDHRQTHKSRSRHPKILAISQGPYKDQRNHRSEVVDEAL